MCIDNGLKVLGDKYFNQNLICCIIAYIGVFFAFKHNICCLLYSCYGLLMITIFSLFLTLSFYTCEYCCRKYYKSKERKLDYELKKAIKGDNIE